MTHRRSRQPGPQRHAEGQHGERTHRRFIEQLHEGVSAKTASQPDVEGGHRLHQDREQHDEAERNSEKTEVERGHTDENVIAHARIPHEGDSR